MFFYKKFICVMFGERQNTFHINKFFLIFCVYPQIFPTGNGSVPIPKMIKSNTVCKNRKAYYLD